MKVAAYQVPFLPVGSMPLDLIRTQIDRCEAGGVKILCCPEAILGGLADYATDPHKFAINVEKGELAAVLAPFASDTVTTILGFTETNGAGRLYNSAAVFHRSNVMGVYRKLHPAIRRSVYEPGVETLVFTVDDLTFGILICNDSNFPELAKNMVSLGARALFIPTNNGLPLERADIVAEAHAVDITLAKENNISVIRTDVAGRIDGMLSYGTSKIVAPDGVVVRAAEIFCEELLIADV
jgi:predicted amidohydrolase